MIITPIFTSHSISYPLLPSHLNTRRLAQTLAQPCPEDYVYLDIFNFFFPAKYFPQAPRTRHTTWPTPLMKVHHRSCHTMPLHHATPATPCHLYTMPRMLHHATYVTPCYSCYTMPLMLHLVTHATPYHSCYTMSLMLNYATHVKLCHPCSTMPHASPFHSCYTMPLMLHYSTHVTPFHSCYTMPFMLHHATHVAYTLLLMIHHATHVTSCRICIWYTMPLMLPHLLY
jgi:hypothetical protein